MADEIIDHEDYAYADGVYAKRAIKRTCTCRCPDGSFVPDMSCPVHVDMYGVLEEQCREEDDDDE